MHKQSDHFQGKDALSHILEKRSQVTSSGSEPHGSEIPSHLSAALLVAKQILFILLLLYVIAQDFNLAFSQIAPILAIFSLGVTIYLAAQKAHQGWSHLERMHRLLEQERYEIQHNRPQERDELRALYQMKGFEGALLEQVLDVLMADDDRLLKVMLEEEMGFDLEIYEHPLKQAFGALCGGVVALLLATCIFLFLPIQSWIYLTLIFLGCLSGLVARLENNRFIPATIWNLAIAILAIGSVHYTLQFLVS